MHVFFIFLNVYLYIFLCAYFCSNHVLTFCLAIDELSEVEEPKDETEEVEEENNEKSGAFFSNTIYVNDHRTNTSLHH